MLKVYCKNCKYRHWLTTHERGYGDRNWACAYTCWDGQNYYACEKVNPKGNCNYYKRIWWKLWIRS